MTRRVRLTVGYDGTGYSGWQRQINAPSVQRRLEDALGRLTGETICVTGASRTDAGVHAAGQVAHFDTHSKIPGDKFCFALNTMLPSDIRVSASGDAPEGFHARFSACGKLYRYLIHNHAHASAIGRNTHAHVIRPLDALAMHEEALSAIGTHDFAAFAASGSIVKDTVRTVFEARVMRSENEVELLVRGDGFLYNMVRILAGTLIAVGSQKLAPGAIARAIDSGCRLDLGPTAPAHGLTLMKVYYPEERPEDPFPAFPLWDESLSPARPEGGAPKGACLNLNDLRQ
jgi:tRNA pseudouridine38-40 synthase